MSGPIKQIERELEAEGFKPNTFPWEAEKRKRQVELCKTLRQVDSCWNCTAFDHCELVKHHLRDLRFHNKNPNDT